MDLTTARILEHLDISDNMLTGHLPAQVREARGLCCVEKDSTQYSTGFEDDVSTSALASEPRAHEAHRGHTNVPQFTLRCEGNQTHHQASLAEPPIPGPHYIV